MTSVSIKIIDRIHTRIWDFIPPLWPFKTMVAVNPLMGFQHLPFDDAILKASAFIEFDSFPESIHMLNRHTIKWCQMLLDLGQAEIGAPFRNKVFFARALELIAIDKRICSEIKTKQDWIKSLPKDPKACVFKILEDIPKNCEDISLYLERLITTLPGWASHIKYLDWTPEQENKKDTWAWSFTALRLLIAHLMKIPLTDFLSLKPIQKTKFLTSLQSIKKQEYTYQKTIFNQLSKSVTLKKEAPSAQFVFCIDVRSEPLRRALESEGFETFGMAGFFSLASNITTKQHDVAQCCPVIVKPMYTIQRVENFSYSAGQKRGLFFHKLYQSLKYNFTTALYMAEAMGPYCGLATLIKNFGPRLFRCGRDKILGSKYFELAHTYNLDSLPQADKIKIGKDVQKVLGINKYAQHVYFIGHGSRTENNAYASSLQCGACGGNPGGDNPQILAEIMNDPSVKKALNIPLDTQFLSGLHDTTREEIIFYEFTPPFLSKIKTAQKAVHAYRKKLLKHSDDLYKRGFDWAQTRPEWGLAQNAFFFVGPRQIIQHMNFEGRAFLHSYDWCRDPHMENLESVLLGPVVVGHWINSQYLFSTLNNVNYGGGSKVTNNVTGKLGVMQGNASDLMNGLALECLYTNDHTNYHTPLRLTICIHAPKGSILKVVAKHTHLKNMAANQWVHLFCVCPTTKVIYKLTQNLQWKQFN